MRSPDRMMEGGSGHVATRVYGIVLTLAYGPMIASTWAHWGHARIDCGGALDRAARVAAGEILYRDVQSPYGPVADQVVAAAFRLFGTHLTVAYAVQIVVLAVASWLLWRIGRRFLCALECAAAVVGFWVFCGVHPFYLQWLFPNSYAAPFGATFSLAALALVLADLERPGTHRLAGASLAAALAGLSKIEFGLAAVAVLVVRVVLFGRADRSWSRLLVLAFVPGAVLTAAIVLLLLVSVPWPVLLYDNLYRVRSFAVTVASLQRFLDRPPWPACLDALVHYGLLLPLWAAAVGVSLHLARARGLRRGLGVVLIPLILGFMLSRWDRSPIDFNPVYYVTSWFFEWTTIGWGLVAVGQLISDRTRRRPETPAVVLAAIYSVVVTLRWKLHVVWPEYYAPLAPLLLIFIVRTLATRLVGATAPTATALVFLVALVPNAYVAWILAASRDTLLDYPRGQLWTSRADDAGLAEVVDWLRANTTPDEYVSVIPEERLINFLAERRNPTPDAGIGPGWLVTPEDRQGFLTTLAARRTRAVVISNRVYGEFGEGMIGDYAPEIDYWVRHTCQRVLRTGMFMVFDCRRAFAR
ncbi:MAG: glycosyltransferase family 39 protein [Candidatus Binatia bacterium]